MLKSFPLSFPSWKMLGASWNEACMFLLTYLWPPITLIWSEVKSSYRPSKHLGNICKNIEGLSKTSRN